MFNAAPNDPDFTTVAPANVEGADRACYGFWVAAEKDMPREVLAMFIARYKRESRPLRGSR